MMKGKWVFIAHYPQHTTIKVTASERDTWDAIQLNTSTQSRVDTPKCLEVLPIVKLSDPLSDDTWLVTQSMRGP
jgi:hypothetical protein